MDNSNYELTVDQYFNLLNIDKLTWNDVPTNIRALFNEKKILLITV